MSPRQTVWIKAAAPPKPAPGAPCNGCGVCCLAEPCPLGRIVFLQWHGACPGLRWEASERRYFCRLLRQAPRSLRWLARRWIAAGAGCDSGVVVE